VGQDWLPSIITPEDFGLKNSSFQVYDIEMDSNGYVYLTGNAGVHKFNGKSLLNLGQKQTGNTDLYTSFFKDNKGKIWLRGMRGRIAYIENNEVIHFAYADSIKNKIRGGLESLYVDSNGTIHLGLRASGYYTISDKGVIRKIVGKESLLHGFVIQQLPDGHSFLYSVFQKEKNGKTKLNLFYQCKNGQFDTILTLNETKAIYESTILEDEDQINLISFGGRDIVKIKGNKLLDHVYFPYNTLKLFEDSDKNLWIGTLNNGIQKIPGNNIGFLASNNAQQYLNGASAAIVEDQNGGVWFKSDSLGFGYIPYPRIVSNTSSEFNRTTKTTYHIVSDGKSVFYIDDKNNVTVISNDSVSCFEAPLNKSSHLRDNQDQFTNGMVYDSINGGLWFLFRGQLVFRNDSIQKIIKIDIGDYKNQMIRDFAILPDGNILLLFQYSILLYDHNSFSVINRTIDRATCISARSKDDILIGTFGGVWKLNGKDWVRPSNSYPVDLEHTIDNIEYSNGIYFIASINKPLYILTEDTFKVATTKSGNQINTYDLSISPEENVWVRSYNSSQLICFKKGESDQKGIVYDFDDMARRVITMKSFLVTSEMIYWGGYDGVFYAKISDLNEAKRSTEVTIKEVRVNQKIVPIQNRYTLGFLENSVYLKFECINFRRRNIQYKYRLMGFDSNWVEEEFQATQYTNLDPGKYQFEVAAKIKEETWGQPRKIVFEISPPFWKTWWFIALEVILVLTVIGLIIRFREKQLLVKESRKAELQRLELRALKAQINPHFIFNSIASVQYYLGMNKTIDAEHYLQRFSKLMRKVLENSEQTKVLLKDELALMSNYIGLESERFQGEPIQLEVKLNDIDAESVFIQPTLLQPYIENAIRHGLRDKKGKRMIQLIFTRVDTQMKVDIIDNGIGRKAARQMQQSKERRSFGMLISNRRIELMNNDSDNPVQYKDLEDDKGNSLGTHVTFLLNIKLTS